jgi:hypothetical protein
MPATPYNIALKTLRLNAAEKAAPDMQLGRDLADLMACFLGRFIQCSVSKRAYYLDKNTGIPVWVDFHSNDWRKILEQFDILLSDKAIKTLCDRAKGIAEIKDIHRLGWYEDTSKCAYVYSQGKSVYRISTTDIACIDNGSDNVFFIREDGAMPFLMGVSASPGKNFSQFLQNIITPASGVLEPDQALFLTSIVFLCMFLNPLAGTVPALMFVGDSGSNKTLILRLFNLLITGNTDAITRYNGDRRIFEHAILSRGFVGVDDMKTWPAWINEIIESIANRESITIPGKPFETLKADCRLALTARILPKECMVKLGRLLPIELQPDQHRKIENKIIQGVKTDRNAIMTDVILLLQQVLICLDTSSGTDYTGQYPLTDFANIAVRFARTTHPHGEKFIIDALDRLVTINSRAIAYLEPEQKILDLMKLWVAENQGRECTPAELLAELEQIAQQRGMSLEVTTSRFGHTLNRLAEKLNGLFLCNKEPRRGRYQYYSFWPKV